MHNYINCNYSISKWIFIPLPQNQNTDFRGGWEGVIDVIYSELLQQRHPYFPKFHYSRRELNINTYFLKIKSSELRAFYLL